MCSLNLNKNAICYILFHSGKSTPMLHKVSTSSIGGRADTVMEKCDKENDQRSENFSLYSGVL